MDAKELAITIAGLIATFSMPWPGEADRPENRAESAMPHVRMGVERCAETVLARLPMRQDARRAEAVQDELQAWRRQ